MASHKWTVKYYVDGRSHMRLLGPVFPLLLVNVCSLSWYGALGAGLPAWSSNLCPVRQGNTLALGWEWGSGSVGFPFHPGTYSQWATGWENKRKVYPLSAGFPSSCSHCEPWVSLSISTGNRMACLHWLWASSCMRTSNRIHLYSLFLLWIWSAFVELKVAWLLCRDESYCLLH